MESQQQGGSGQHDDVPESVQLQKELLWGDYLELLTQSRHIETVRVNAVNLVLVMTAALATLITFDRTIDTTDIVPSLIITSAGLLSTVFSVAYLERYDKNKRRASKIRDELDRRFFSPPYHGLTELRATADKELPASQRSERTAHLYRWILRKSKYAVGSTHMFWVVVPMFVSLTGIVLTVLSLVGLPARAQ